MPIRQADGPQTRDREVTTRRAWRYEVLIAAPGASPSGRATGPLPTPHAPIRCRDQSPSPSGPSARPDSSPRRELAPPPSAAAPNLIGRFLIVILAPSVLWVFYLPVSFEHDPWDWNMALLASVAYLPILARLLDRALPGRRDLPQEALDAATVLAAPFCGFFLIYTLARISQLGGN